MAKPMFDADALITMFETATARQGEQLKKAASEATLAALQGRELSLKNIRAALISVTEAVSAGAAKNTNAGIHPEAMLEQAVAGMDQAMLRAVEANHTALSSLMSQGADMRDKHLQKAMSDLDKLEDTLMATMKKAAAGAGAPMASAWAQVLEKTQAGGTLSGAQATQTLEQMAEQMQTTLRSTRAAGMRAAQVMAESYTAMVSGVLLGMSEAMQSGAAASKPKSRK